MNKSTILYKTLARALSMMRPHNSEGTRRLTDWLQERVPTHARTHRDGAGNLHVDTRLNPSNRTLFVAHVDTVHRKEGANKIKQTPTYWYADGAALGADDGAGVAMLMHLMHSGVPAYYVFTQGEECGGIGATYLAKHDAKLLSEFDRAIAFDRRGIDSVITHQGRGRCCSDAFADALSDALNADMTLMYLPDNTGVGVNSAWHHLSDDDYDYDSYTIELQEALYDAQAGSKQWLIELMCESVWPEDPEMAERLIDRNKIDEALLAHALKQSVTYDPTAVLAEIFDQSYAA
jgi:hypothetical protein